MATITEEERKRLLDQMKEKERTQTPSPRPTTTNPKKFTMPVTPPLTPGGYDVDGIGSSDRSRGNSGKEP